MPDKSKEIKAISELPVDELIRYGQGLGLDLSPKMGHGELLRLVRRRQELLLELDREAMLDIVVWARRPVRQSAGKESLAKEISSVIKADFRDLSYRGLMALARLRGLPVYENEPREQIEARMRAHEPITNRIRRTRRRVMGSVISKVVNGTWEQKESEEYRFLPEQGQTNGHSLKEHITDEGVVGGIARRLRGAADEYLQEKMDEIETRIDQKLDEIDQRLAEWRDREIANRLKIIKITLVASVLVALLSLGYKYVVHYF